MRRERERERETEPEREITVLNLSPLTSIFAGVRCEQPNQTVGLDQKSSKEVRNILDRSKKFGNSLPIGKPTTLMVLAIIKKIKV